MEMLGTYLLQQLRQLQEKKVFCDLELVSLDGECISIHELIFVALNQRHFDIAIRQGWRAGHGQVGTSVKKKMTLPLSASEMMVFVQFMYGNTIATISKYDTLLKALDNLDMPYLLDVVGGFTLEDDTHIKTELENSTENLLGEIHNSEDVNDSHAKDEEYRDSHSGEKPDESAQSLDISGLSVSGLFAGESSLTIKQEPMSPACMPFIETGVSQLTGHVMSDEFQNTIEKGKPIKTEERVCSVGTSEYRVTEAVVAPDQSDNSLESEMSLIADELIKNDQTNEYSVTETEEIIKEVKREAAEMDVSDNLTETEIKNTYKVAQQILSDNESSVCKTISENKEPMVDTHNKLAGSVIHMKQESCSTNTDISKIQIEPYSDDSYISDAGSLEISSVEKVLSQDCNGRPEQSQLPKPNRLQTEPDQFLSKNFFGIRKSEFTLYSLQSSPVTVQASAKQSMILSSDSVKEKQSYYQMPKQQSRTKMSSEKTVNTYCGLRPRASSISDANPVLTQLLFKKSVHVPSRQSSSAAKAADRNTKKPSRKGKKSISVCLMDELSENEREILRDLGTLKSVDASTCNKLEGIDKKNEESKVEEERAKNVDELVIPASTVSCVPTSEMITLHVEQLRRHPSRSKELLSQNMIENHLFSQDMIEDHLLSQDMIKDQSLSQDMIEDQSSQDMTEGKVESACIQEQKKIDRGHVDAACKISASERAAEVENVETRTESILLSSKKAKGSVVNLYDTENLVSKMGKHKELFQCKRDHAAFQKNEVHVNYHQDVTDCVRGSGAKTVKKLTEENNPFVSINQSEVSCSSENVYFEEKLKETHDSMRAVKRKLEQIRAKRKSNQKSPKSTIVSTGSGKSRKRNSIRVESKLQDNPVIMQSFSFPSPQEHQFRSESILLPRPQDNQVRTDSILLPRPQDNQVRREDILLFRPQDNQVRREGILLPKTLDNQVRREGALLPKPQDNQVRREGILLPRSQDNQIRRESILLSRPQDNQVRREGIHLSRPQDNQVGKEGILLPTPQDNQVTREGILLPTPQDNQVRRKGILLSRPQDNQVRRESILLPTPQDNQVRREGILLPRPQDNQVRREGNLLPRSQDNPIMGQSFLLSGPQNNHDKTQGILLSSAKDYLVNPQDNPVNTQSMSVPKSQDKPVKRQSISVPKSPDNLVYTQSISMPKPQNNPVATQSMLLPKVAVTMKVFPVCLQRAETDDQMRLCATNNPLLTYHLSPEWYPGSDHGKKRKGLGIGGGRKKQQQSQMKHSEHDKKVLNKRKIEFSSDNRKRRKSELKFVGEESRVNNVLENEGRHRQESETVCSSESTGRDFDSSVERKDSFIDDSDSDSLDVPLSVLRKQRVSNTFGQINHPNISVSSTDKIFCLTEDNIENYSDKLAENKAKESVEQEHILQVDQRQTSLDSVNSSSPQYCRVESTVGSSVCADERNIFSVLNKMTSAPKTVKTKKRKRGKNVSPQSGRVQRHHLSIKGEQFKRRLALEKANKKQFSIMQKRLKSLNRYIKTHNIKSKVKYSKLRKSPAHSSHLEENLDFQGSKEVIDLTEFSDKENLSADKSGTGDLSHHETQQGLALFWPQEVVMSSSGSEPASGIGRGQMSSIPCSANSVVYCCDSGQPKPVSVSKVSQLPVLVSLLNSPVSLTEASSVTVAAVANQVVTSSPSSASKPLSSHCPEFSGRVLSKSLSFATSCVTSSSAGVTAAYRKILPKPIFYHLNGSNK